MSCVNVFDNLSHILSLILAPQLFSSLISLSLVLSSLIFIFFFYYLLIDFHFLLSFGSMSLDSSREIIARGLEKEFA